MKEPLMEDGNKAASGNLDDSRVRLLPENTEKKPRIAVHPEDYAESWELGDPDCERIRAPQ